MKERHAKGELFEDDVELNQNELMKIRFVGKKGLIASIISIRAPFVMQNRTLRAGWYGGLRQRPYDGEGTNLGCKSYHSEKIGT